MDLVSEVFNGHRMEFLTRFDNNFFDFAIDDPPYGNGGDAVGLKNEMRPVSNNWGHAAERKDYFEFDNVAPPPEYFELLQLKSREQIIWGGNFFGLKGGYICWNKNGTTFGEAELAWCSFSKAVRLIEYTWNGMIQADMKNKETRIHSCQKPIKLYEALIREYVVPRFKGEGRRPRVIDCHMGSQTLRIACWRLGIDFYGCELSPDIFATGCNYFEQHKGAQLLF